MKKILFTLAILIFATSTYAQTPAVGTSKLGWDQDATTLVEAMGLTYKYYVDEATVGVLLANVTCSGNAGSISTFQCEAPFPAFKPGTHFIALTANSLAGESPKSTPLFGFTFVVIPAAPKNVKTK